MSTTGVRLAMGFDAGRCALRAIAEAGNPFTHWGHSQRTGPSRRRLAYIIVALACVTPASLALAATSASAYKRINEACILRVNEPVPFGDGVFAYGGRVDCSSYGKVWTEGEVCAEVQNTVNGKWYKINGSCRQQGKVFREENEIFPIYHEGDCGVNYRTWDRGRAWHGGESGLGAEWGSQKEYESSSVNNCC
jgi:hypothetical protein